MSGLDRVTGFNLHAQIGDGRGGQFEPVFQMIEFGGSLWEAHPYSVTGGVVVSDPQLAVASMVLNNTGDEVLADGLLVTLIINTTGVFLPGDTFDLKLSIDESDQNSEFIVFGGEGITPALSTGTIQLFEASVVGRHLFYNESYFDGKDSAATVDDDNAIASDKAALLPGQTASFANYSSYWRGINGMMIDILGLSDPAGLTLDDFEFKVGNDNDPAGWALAPAPINDIAASVRIGAGVMGSDRVVLIWENSAIQKQWLQITIKANAITGLAESDIFYFGNAVGESGNSPTNTFVDGTDFAGARDNQRNFLNRAPIDFAYDYNRDSFVDGTDMAVARDNNTNFITALKVITVPAPMPLSLTSMAPLAVNPALDEGGIYETSILSEETSTEAVSIPPAPVEIEGQGTGILPGHALAPVLLNEYMNIGLPRMMSDLGAGLTFVDVTVTNTSAQTVSGPLQLILKEISSPDVTLAHPDGQTSDGKDYVDLTNAIDDGSLDPGKSVMVRLYFVNSFRRRFTFELGVWGVLS